MASALDRARLPTHKTISKEEKYALNTLKKDHRRLVLKADKGNCFVVMDKNDYESKMETILNDEKTYEKTTRPLFKKIERQLNNKLLDLKNHDKLDETTYRRLRSTDGTLPTIRYSFKHHKEGNPLRPIVTCTNSTLYNTSRFLTEILSPLQNKNGFSLKIHPNFPKKWPIPPSAKMT